MIKVSLLGDSILGAGYGKYVPRLLGEEFEVYQSDDNCRFSKYTIRRLFDMKGLMAGSRIVHWNNGLWDICDLFGDGPFSDEDEYVKNMLRIADILQERYEKVIFATTTPVTERNMYDKNPVIKRYNEVIVPLLEKRGIIINDLHSLIATNVDRYIKSDNIHLTDEAAMLCAQQVVKVIKDAAKTLNSAETKVTCDTDEPETGLPVIVENK